MSAPRVSILERSPVIFWGAIIAVIIVILRVVQAVPYLGAHGVVVDFDAFYIVGQMFWEGALYDAYDVKITQDRQSALAGKTVFMPWAYPPQFNMIAAVLPFGPRGLSYAVFMLAGFALYAFTLRRLAGSYAAAVLFVLTPAMCFNAWIGQNGFLTGGLVGLAALGWISGRAAATGIPLGLMVIKPHLVVGLGILALVSPRWKVVGWAIATILASSALATLCFGAGIWPVFLGASQEATQNMGRGYYPLYRMVSVYTVIHSFRLGVDLAMVLHLAVALSALAVILWLARWSGWSVRRVFGMSVLLSLLVSPYNYDYDLPLMGVGLACVAADLVERGRWWERLSLMALCWAAASSGLLQSTSRVDPSALIYGKNWFPHAYGGLFYLPLVVLVFVILRRAHQRGLVSSAALAG